MKLTILILSILLSFNTYSKIFSGKVVSIYDGDTMKISIEDNNSKKIVKIRFLGIDTPELKFFNSTQGKLAYEARDYLRNLIPIGTIVDIKTGQKEVDRNTRILGEVFYEGLNINLELLTQGLAVMYFIYPYNKTQFNNYREACINTYNLQLGIFDPTQNTQIPYEWRMNIQERKGTN